VLAKPFAACTHLSSTVFQLFEPQLQTRSSAIADKPLVEVWQDFLSKYVDKKFTYIYATDGQLDMDESIMAAKLCNLQQLKIAVFTYRSPHFVSTGDAPAICCTDGKTIQCLPNPSHCVPIYLQQFPSYAMLKSMRKSKNRYFLPHFCFPWGHPWGNHAKCCMDGKRIR